MADTEFVPTPSWISWRKALTDYPRRSEQRYLHLLNKYAQLAVRRAQTHYLVGGNPLHVRTGRGRSSVTKSMAQKIGMDFVVRVGSRVFYMAIHEDGGRFTYNVPAHTRIITKAFGKSIDPVVAHVRGHTRTSVFPARPWLRPAVRDQLPSFENELENIGRALL